METRRNYTQLGILVREDPKRAAGKIRAILRQTKGNASEAARRSGISHASLLRYFRRLREAGFSVREEGRVGRATHDGISSSALAGRSRRIACAMEELGHLLSPVEAGVLRLKYPYPITEDGHPQSGVKVAAMLGMSRQAVQKAEERALVKLGLSPD